MTKEQKPQPEKPELPHMIEWEYGGLYADRLEPSPESWQKFVEHAMQYGEKLVIESSNSQGASKAEGSDVLVNTLDVKSLQVKNLTPEDDTWRLEYDAGYSVITLYPQTISNILRDRGKNIEPAIFAQELDASFKRALSRYVLERKIEITKNVLETYMTHLKPALQLILSLALAAACDVYFAVDALYKVAGTDTSRLIETDYFIITALHIVQCSFAVYFGGEILSAFNKVKEHAQVQYVAEYFPMKFIYQLFVSWLVIQLNHFVTYEDNNDKKIK